jgi:hypothetical protein
MMREGNAMFRRCCICRSVFGEKAPFSEPGETTGICDVCYLPYLEKIRKEAEAYRNKDKQKHARRA